MSEPAQPFDQPGARKAGRPTVWTREIEERLLQALRAGNYVETAAALVGIHKDTLYARLKRGARGENAEDVGFSQAVQAAMAAAETRDVALIAQAAGEDWKAAAWRLERKHPQRWGRNDRVTVLNQLQREVEGLSDDELLALLAGDAAELDTDAPGES